MIARDSVGYGRFAAVRRVLVLGADTATGRRLLDLVRAHPDRLAVVDAGRLADGADALVALAGGPDVDVVVGAGGSNQRPALLAAAAAGKRVVLADLATAAAGRPLRDAAAKSGGLALPADAALTAVWQCLRGEPTPLRRVILPVGAGAPHEDRCAALRVAALDALLDVPPVLVEVVEHPEGLVQAMVEFPDGSVKTVLAADGQSRALEYALAFPERWPSPFSRVNLVAVGTLTFRPADLTHRPLLRAALAAGALAAPAG